MVDTVDVDNSLSLVEMQKKSATNLDYRHLYKLVISFYGVL